MSQAVEVYNVMSARVSPIVKRAQEVEVVDLQSYTEAAGFLTDIKRLSNEVEAQRKKITQPLNESLRAANDMFKLLSGPLGAGESAVKSKMESWYAADQRRRQEEARKAAEEARKIEEAERAKLEKKAAKAEATGKTEKAEELRQQAAAVYVESYEPEPIDVTFATGAGGVTMRQDIGIIITDPYKVMEAVLAGVLPETVVTISAGAIKRFAKASGLKPGATTIPGVRIVPEINSAVRVAAKEE